MENYRRFVKGGFFKYIAFACGIMFALITIFAIISAGSKPMDTTELKIHGDNLELIQQDFDNLKSIANITLETTKDGMTIFFKGDVCSFKAYLDTEGNCIHSEIIDERVTSSFVECTTIVVIAFFIGVGAVLGIQAIMHIPLVINWIVNRVPRKKKR